MSVCKMVVREDGCLMVVVGMLFDVEDSEAVNSVEVGVIDFVVRDEVAGLIDEEAKVEDTGDALKAVDEIVLGFVIEGVVESVEGSNVVITVVVGGVTFVVLSGVVNEVGEYDEVSATVVVDDGKDDVLLGLITRVAAAVVD